MRHLKCNWLLDLYYEIEAAIAGVKKHALIVNNSNTIFSYYEKGKRVPGQASLIFIHGFSSNKESWLSLIKSIPHGYHCIIMDLPGHGETIEFREDDQSLDAFIDKIKLFLDEMNLTKPMCFIGASIGATIVAIFATKYPEYVGLICLLAPAPIRQYESDLIKQLRFGEECILLPETSQEFHKMVDILTVKETKLPKRFVKIYFKSRLTRLDTQKEILRSFLRYEYINLEQYYEKLRNLNCPALIIWGRQDRLCMVESVEYFAKLISDTEVTIFDDCGHFISYDKPKETARNIIRFFDRHSYISIEL